MATIVCQCTTTSSFLVRKLGFYMHGSCSPAYMANTATNTWQPVCSSIKTLHSRLELTRQMRSTISAAHMLLAVGKFPKTIYDSLHKPLVSVFRLIFPPSPLQIFFFCHVLFPQKQMQRYFVVQIFLTLLCCMCPSCVVCHTKKTCSICNM